MRRRDFLKSMTALATGTALPSAPAVWSPAKAQSRQETLLIVSESGPNNIDILCLLIPQDAASDHLTDDFEVSLDEIEQATKLRFFPKWTAQGVSPHAAVPTDIHTRHRLAKKIER